MKRNIKKKTKEEILTEGVGAITKNTRKNCDDFSPII